MLHYCNLQWVSIFTSGDIQTDFLPLWLASLHDERERGDSHRERIWHAHKGRLQEAAAEFLSLVVLCYSLWLAEEGGGFGGSVCMPRSRQCRAGPWYQKVQPCRQ